MSEEEVENSLWISVACSFAVLAAVSLSYTVLEPNGGVDWKIHAVYWAAAVCSISFIPHEITSYIFTELTVTLVGAVYCTRFTMQPRQCVLQMKMMTRNGCR